MKPTTKSCETDAMVVDQHLNTAYDTVKEVRDALPWLRDLANLLGPKLDHTQLNNNDVINQHPIEAITGLVDALSGKQTRLISQTNIKSINGVSVLGSGNISTRMAPVVIAEAAPAWIDGPSFDGHMWFDSATGVMYLYKDVDGDMTWVFQYTTVVEPEVFPEVIGNIDMHGYKIFNLPEPTNPTEPVRVQDFAGMLAKVGSGITMIPTTSLAFEVGEAQGNNHYLVTTLEPAQVLVKRAMNFTLNQQATIIYFTQMGDGEVELVPDIGVTLVYPDGYVPNTFSKGATIAIESLSSSQWLLVGNLGFE